MKHTQMIIMLDMMGMEFHWNDIYQKAMGYQFHGCGGVLMITELNKQDFYIIKQNISLTRVTILR